ncbi:unnamed protein product [Taenia asiatica]|uniref:Core protein n=1 Tax=Taenia asiatica TaxID=60517 RepID=A0A0R3VYD4_TAEAS|nr:unnamed protein product [Taenia asiatica]
MGSVMVRTFGPALRNPLPPQGIRRSGRRR